MYFKEYAVSAYMFVIVLSSRGIDPIIIVKYPSLFAPVLVFVLSYSFFFFLLLILAQLFWLSFGIVYMAYVCPSFYIQSIYFFESKVNF